MGEDNARARRVSQQQFSSPGSHARQRESRYKSSTVLYVCGLVNVNKSVKRSQTWLLIERCVYVFRHILRHLFGIPTNSPTNMFTPIDSLTFRQNAHVSKSRLCAFQLTHWSTIQNATYFSSVYEILSAPVSSPICLATSSAYKNESALPHADAQEFRN